MWVKIDAIWLKLCGLGAANIRIKLSENLIFGICTIKRKPWKPVKDDIYWTVLSSEVIRSYMWKNDTTDLLSYKLGNCYKTQEEAEYNYDKWVAFYASDEVLEV